MKYALERLYKLITYEIEPTSYAGHALQAEQLQTWIARTSKEKENITLYLQRKVVRTGKRKALQLLVQEYQSTIVRLLDQVFLYKTTYPNHQLQGIYESILQLLEQLLTVIEEQHYRYFNLEEKVPRNYLLVCRQDLHSRANAVKKQLVKKGHDEELIKIVLQPIMDLSGSTRKQLVTYQMLFYVKDLLIEIAELDNHCTSSTCYPPLVDLLIYLNFNSTPFKKYLIRFINKEFNRTESAVHKTEKMLFHLKEISQLQEKHGVSLHSKVPSIKELMKGWLHKEVAFLENKQNLGIVVPEIKEENLLETGFLLGLTVDEIALLLRAMTNADLLLNKNTKKMLEDASKVVHTKRQYHVSNQGLSKSYYNIEMNTVNSLSDKMMLLVNTLRKMGTGLK